MVKLSQFFGLVIDEKLSDFAPILHKLKVSTAIEQTEVVRQLKKQNGRDAPIVNVGRKQQVLKLIKPLLDAKMLPYDERYFKKEINTSTERDRRYGAEEKLLEFALLVATNKSRKIREADGKAQTMKHLRDPSLEDKRFKRFWDLLSESTAHIVAAYRKGK